jgi:hypothetical protein
MVVSPTEESTNDSSADDQSERVSESRVIRRGTTAGPAAVPAGAAAGADGALTALGAKGWLTRLALEALTVYSKEEIKLALASLTLGFIGTGAVGIGTSLPSGPRAAEVGADRGAATGLLGAAALSLGSDCCCGCEVDAVSSSESSSLE